MLVFRSPTGIFPSLGGMSSKLNFSANTDVDPIISKMSSSSSVSVRSRNYATKNDKVYPVGDDVVDASKSKDLTVEEEVDWVIKTGKIDDSDIV